MIYSISGYWKDDQDEFEDYLVCDNEYNNDAIDEKIFFYGLSKEDIEQMIEDGEETGEDFVITSYKKYLMS